MLGRNLTLDELALRQTVPHRGSTAQTLPIDPLLYRFYEPIQFCGTTIKAPIEEELGDGIMNAINFSTDTDRKAHPKCYRVIVTLNGRSLHYEDS